MIISVYALRRQLPGRKRDRGGSRLEAEPQSPSTVDISYCDTFIHNGWPYRLGVVGK